jgi:hypothetical protein
MQCLQIEFPNVSKIEEFHAPLVLHIGQVYKTECWDIIL